MALACTLWKRVSTRLKLCDVDTGRVKRRTVVGGTKHCTVRVDSVSRMHPDTLCAGGRSEKQTHITFPTLTLMIKNVL